MNIINKHVNNQHSLDLRGKALPRDQSRTALLPIQGRAVLASIYFATCPTRLYASQVFGFLYCCLNWNKIMSRKPKKGTMESKQHTDSVNGF